MKHLGVQSFSMSAVSIYLRIMRLDSQIMIGQIALRCVAGKREFLMLEIIMGLVLWHKWTGALNRNRCDSEWSSLPVFWYDRDGNEWLESDYIRRLTAICERVLLFGSHYWFGSRWLNSYPPFVTALALLIIWTSKSYVFGRTFRVSRSPISPFVWSSIH